MNIVGQTKLQQDLTTLIDNDSLPRFLIFYGESGSGKKLLTEWLSRKLNATFVPCDLKVDAVRSVISNAYTLTSPTVYMWGDADKMSVGAKNAILKVTEEPPLQAYFVLTLQNLTNTLPTLTSRACVFPMDTYTYEELKYFATNTPEIFFSEAELNLVLDTCTNIQQIYDMNNYKKTADIMEFYEFVEKVINILGTATGSNTLKISTFFKYSEKDESGYNLLMFMRALMTICLNKYMKVKPCVAYADVINITSYYMSQLSISGINQQATVDCWLLDIRDALKQVQT